MEKGDGGHHCPERRLKKNLNAGGPKRLGGQKRNHKTGGLLAEGLGEEGRGVQKYRKNKSKVGKVIFAVCQKRN